jgi:hypothetical protein
MHNSLKALLWSGLVFPGLGQIVLKRHKRGVALILAVLVGLALIVITTVQQALSLLDKIDVEGGPVDMQMISNLATQASTNVSNSSMFILGASLIILVWIIGAFDAYMIGKKKDGEEGLISKASNDNETV